MQPRNVQAESSVCVHTCCAQSIASVRVCAHMCVRLPTCRMHFSTHLCSRECTCVNVCTGVVRFSDSCEQETVFANVYVHNARASIQTHKSGCTCWFLRAREHVVPCEHVCSGVHLRSFDRACIQMCVHVHTCFYDRQTYAARVAELVCVHKKCVRMHTGMCKCTYDDTCGSTCTFDRFACAQTFLLCVHIITNTKPQCG